MGDNSRGYWRFERDCTVDGEIISPVLHDTPEHWQQLQQVVEIVKRHGGSVNQRCGGHIHIGCGDYDHTPDNHTRLVNSFAAQQDVLYRLAQDPQSDAHRELRGSTWSSPVAKKPEGFRSLDEVRRTLNSHQVALNFQSVTGSGGDHVEFRLWDGSLDAGTIQTQIKLSLAMTDYAFRARTDEVAALPDVPRGTHDRRNPGGERLSGDAWEQQTAQFRQFVDRYFTRPEDKAQVTALFAATQWQPERPRSARQQQLRQMRKQHPDADLSDLRQQVAALPVREMSTGEEVSAFLQRHAPQAPARSASTIAGNPDAYAVVSNGLGEPVACAEVTRNGSSGWYQAEVTRLAIDEQATPAQVIPVLTQTLQERAQAQRSQNLALSLPAGDTARSEALHAAGWRAVATVPTADGAPGTTLWYRSVTPVAGSPLPMPPAAACSCARATPAPRPFATPRRATPLRSGTSPSTPRCPPT